MTAIPEAYRPSGDCLDLAPFHALMKRLRDPERGCPWDASQTLEKMAKSLLGEAEEAAEALRGDDARHQCEELGDVLLNLMLAVVIAEEAGRFSWKDVVTGVSEKLVRRHPHVFAGREAHNPQEALEMFLEAKAQERKG